MASSLLKTLRPYHFKLAVITLALAGPFLAFPDRLPNSYRTSVVTAVAGLSFALAAVSVRRWPDVRWSTWILLGATSLSWATMHPHDDVAIRHMGGIALGVLLMSVTAEWSQTSRRLVQAAIVFTIGAMVIVAVGLAGTQVNPSKFVAGVELVPSTFYSRMPRFKLGLPGLDNGGFVNPNGLGGAAVLVLPVCAALAAWAWRGRRWAPLVLGMAASLLSLLALTVTLSRTAVLAAVLTGITTGLWWRPSRRWVLSFLAIVVFVIAVRSARSGTASLRAGTQVVTESVEFRASTWKTALAAIAGHPWLGVGINQFHEAVPSGTPGTSYVAHAHNIFIQVALDIGLIGLVGYAWLMGRLVWIANRLGRGSGATALLAAGAGLSLVGVHLFGLGDAIALGAKVGAFQWLAAGLILGASMTDRNGAIRPSRVDEPPPPRGPAHRHPDLIR